MPSPTEPPSPRAGSPPSPRTRLRRSIVVAGVVLIVAFAASSVYDVVRAYRQTLAATDRELTNLAHSLAEQTVRTFQTIDVLLRDTADWYAAAGRRMPPQAVQQALADRAAGLPQVRVLLIADAGGVTRYSSRELQSRELDVSDRSYFFAQRDRAAPGLFISEPIVTRVDPHLAFVLSRRLAGGAEGFGGVVAVVVDVDDFGQFYRAIDPGAGSTINLLRDDGTLLARNPAAPEALGRRFPELLPPLDAKAVSGGDAVRVISPIDGSRRLTAGARVRGFPFVVSVSRSESVALAAWSEQTAHVVVRTLALSLLAAVLIAALVQQLRRVDAGEHALRESEERYALAMEGSDEGHWDWDLATDRLFLSPKMKALHGRREDEPVSTRAEWLARVEIAPDDRLRLEAAVREHFDGKTPYYELEYRVRHADGTFHWLHTRGRCLRDASGSPYRFVGSAVDVTARKEAESERERLEAELRRSQKMEAMGTLAGGIAHDFNNILGAILGYGELAQKGSGADGPVRRHLDQVMQAGSRAKALVERILAFSRSGLGERVPVHVESVVHETLELLAASLPPRVRLERKLAAGDAAVIGDATQLHQLVMNLCTNAVHAMSHGGVLAVTLERANVARATALSHGTLAPRTYVRLAVSDTGSGIPPAVLDRMFDPFFTTKGVGQGTGLGLSLVHGIVADLGGAIDIATKIGEGTTFAIWLPVAGEIVKPAIEVDRELPRGNGESVMIVDDEPPLVMLAEEILAELGYEPVGFGSSVDALQAFRADPGRFDLVLTDETMPDLTGTELAREIRRLRSDVPIVLMSGYSGAQLAERAQAAGVSDVLRKPLERRDIAEPLARVLGSAR